MKFSDPIKTLLLAGIGAAAVTTEKSKECIDALVTKGEITVEEGKALNQELKHKASVKKTDRFAEKIAELSKEERDALRAKLDEADAAEAEDSDTANTDAERAADADSAE
jgi:polyhydroxyalkanoate synthesis regulator phasin